MRLVVTVELDVDEVLWGQDHGLSKLSEARKLAPAAIGGQVLEALRSNLQETQPGTRVIRVDVGAPAPATHLR